MNSIEMLEALNDSPCGIYAVNAEQTIIYWNPAAERILGHKRKDALGRPCYEVCASLSENGSAPICAERCPSLALAAQGSEPTVSQVRMRCSSGERKPVSLIPLIVSDVGENDETVVAHLFHEQTDSARAAEIVHNARSLIAKSDVSFQPLSRRELQTLRLIAQSLDTREIAARLNISRYTVHDHIRNTLKKLNAKDRLGAVLIAQRLDLL